MKKTFFELLKETDPQITDKEIKVLEGRFVDFGNWIEKNIEDKNVFPLNQKIIKAFWDMYACPNLYYCTKGRVMINVHETLSDAINFIRTNEGPERVKEFIDFVKLVEKEYPGAIQMISPDKFMNVFEKDEVAMLDSVYNRGEDPSEVINITTSEYIEVIISNYKKSTSENQKMKAFN